MTCAVCALQRGWKYKVSLASQTHILFVKLSFCRAVDQVSMFSGFKGDCFQNILKDAVLNVNWAPCSVFPWWWPLAIPTVWSLQGAKWCCGTGQTAYSVGYICTLKKVQWNSEIWFWNTVFEVQMFKFLSICLTLCRFHVFHASDVYLPVSLYTDLHNAMYIYIYATLWLPWTLVVSARYVASVATQYHRHMYSEHVSLVISSGEDVHSFGCYCWWKKSCTTWDVSNPANIGITYHINWLAGFQPSTVSMFSHRFQLQIYVTTVAFFIEVAELSGVSFRIKDLQLKGRLEVLLYVVVRS